jgi:hypothetical protein
LKVSFGSTSTIQLVSPLTKEQVAIDNSGGGNWGAWGGNVNQIKTIERLKKKRGEKKKSSSNQNKN